MRRSDIDIGYSAEGHCQLVPIAVGHMQVFVPVTRSAFPTADGAPLSS
jgi:hypothetical protein